MYKPINGYTKAKIIETIQTRMLDRPCVVDEFNGCAYKNKEGNRCAIGAFIPDGHPAEMFFGSVKSLAFEVLGIYDILPLDLDACVILQNIHDGNTYGDRSDRRPALIAWVEANVED